MAEKHNDAVTAKKKNYFLPLLHAALQQQKCSKKQEITWDECAYEILEYKQEFENLF